MSCWKLLSQQTFHTSIYANTHDRTIAQYRAVSRAILSFNI
ncbi:hypothetical protein [Egbenema bharatensis]